MRRTGGRFVDRMQQADEPIGNTPRRRTTKNHFALFSVSVAGLGLSHGDQSDLFARGRAATNGAAIVVVTTDNATSDALIS